MQKTFKNIAEFFHCSADYLLELNEEKLTITTGELTTEQFAHISAPVKEFQRLNKIK